MKYRIVKRSDELDVITEDGGVASIRYADEMEENDGRTAVTDYYQTRITQEVLDSGESIWDYLGEGKMYCEDWYRTDFDNPKLVQDALEWLCAGHTKFQYDETIWEGF